MQFYQSCFGGVLSLKRLEDTPFARAMPEEFQQLIIEAVLNSEAITLFASDLGAENTSVVGNRVSILFKASGYNEFMKVYKLLSNQSICASNIPEKSDRGEMTNLTDKYGVNWILCFD
jgi:PhnB protein